MKMPIPMVRRRGRLVLLTIFLILIGMTCIAALLFLTAFSTSPASSQASKDTFGSANAPLPLDVRPNPVSMRIVTMGSSAHTAMTLHNPSLDTIVVERFNASCPCLVITPIPLVVAAGTTKALQARLDLSSERDFHGGLRIEVAGLDFAGALLFKTHVDVEVRPQNPGLKHTEHENRGEEGQ